MTRHIAFPSAVMMIGMTGLNVSARDHKAQHFNAMVSEALEEVAPDEFPQHGAPNFVFHSNNKNFIFGIGGAVKATLSFDFGDPTDNGYAFITSEIPVHPEPGNGGKWMMNAQSSYIYFNFVALPGDKNQIGAYVNFNFIGKDYCPTLNYAYLKWRDITAGYGYTLFTDQEAAASTIDYQGPNSFTGVQMAILNYEKTFGGDRRWKFGVGMNMPMTSITPEEKVVSAVNQRLPDIPAYIQYGSEDGSSHLRFSAILRNMYYRDDVLSRNIDQIGWGIKLSGMTPLNNRFAIMGQMVYGEGISSYYQDLTDAGADLCFTRNKGTLSPVKSWGGYLGFDWTLTRRLHFNGTYSHIRLYPDLGQILPGETYRYAQYVVSTMHYNFTNWLSGGLEYIYGRRVQPNGLQRHDSRILAGLHVSF